MTHPYEHLPDSAFWSRSISRPGLHEIDPVVSSPVHLSSDDAVATMGSCFAQHIARFLHKDGLHYLVTEPGPVELDSEERRIRGYGVFTARFGNVYTVRQGNQLLARAFGEREPDEAPWRDAAGNWVDPFRPTVEPGGFPTLRAMMEDRSTHLAAVRAMVHQASLLVFTLGLTEGWRSRRTGVIYPLVPGAAGGTFHPDEHEFVNYGINDVIADLRVFCEELHRHNEDPRLLLPVTPVR